MELKFSEKIKNGASTCRLCSKESGIISIFDTLESVRLFEEAMCCAEIKISPNDGLPDRVCETCSNHLVDSHRFRVQCEASDRSFRSIASVTSKIEEEINLKFESVSDNSCDVNHMPDDNDSGNDWEIAKVEAKSSNILENKTSKMHRHSYCPKCQCPIRRESNTDELKSNHTTTNSLKPAITVGEVSCSCTFSHAKWKGRHLKKLKSRRSSEQKIDPKVETNEDVEVPTAAETKKAILRLRLDLFEDRVVGLEQAPSVSTTDTTADSFPAVALEKGHRKRKRRKTMNCNVCLKTYSSFGHLQKHIWRGNCNTKNNNTKVSKPRHVIERIEKDNRNGHDDIKTEENDEAVNEVISSKIDRDLSRSHMCDQCGKTFKQRMVLQQHMHTHSDVKMYSCDLCSKRFTRKAHVVAHLRIHDNIKPYVCETCGRSFNKSSDLGRHRRIHSDARNFPCPLCGRGFKRSGDIASHMRSHTGDRPYKCVRCDKSYTTHSSLQKHRRAKCTPDIGRMDRNIAAVEPKPISTMIHEPVLQQTCYKIA